MPVGRQSFDDIAIVIEIHIPAGTEGRHFTIVDGRPFFPVRIVNHHETATADIACRRKRYRQRESGRDARIHCIAAPGENVRPDPGGDVAGTHHHAAFTTHRLSGGSRRDYSKHQQHAQYRQSDQSNSLHRFHLPKRLIDPLIHRLVECIHQLRPVQRDERHSVVDLV